MQIDVATVRRRVGVAAVVGALLLVSGSGVTNPGSGGGPQAFGDTRTARSAPPKKLAIAVANLADKATDVATGPTLDITAPGGVVQKVLLTAAGEPPVEATSTDGRNWIPVKQLAYETTYTLNVAAGGPNTIPTTLSRTFTTMGRPGDITGADMYVGDGETYGVGMPIVVEFTNGVPKAQRATVERRLQVTSTPKVEGVWHWFSNTEVHYRTKDYWPSGSKVNLRLAIGGMPFGNGSYGKRDRVANFTIGPKMVSHVDAKAHQMVVYKDDKPIRRMPVSLGKPGFASSSGTFVLMEKAYSKIFDSSTYGLPVDDPEGYRLEVFHTLRYTWRGEFFHSAPWSEGDQGKRNVSHGCVNLSAVNAEWFFENSRKGDVATIVNTGQKVDPGNGWTDWAMSWDQYRAGSALAKPAAPAPSNSASAPTGG
jgi:lipoprotein-anchoring transpeptidase ErfK/SrfK